MSFQSFKNLHRAKKCRLSGLPLDSNTFSIDRIDHNKGYVKGNVCACHTVVNRLKNELERPSKEIDTKAYLKVLKNVIKHL